MGKVPLKVRRGKQTSRGMQPSGSAKGLRRHPELSTRRLLSLRRMWRWRRRRGGRARRCFFSTRRKGVKRRRPSERSGPPPADLPGRTGVRTPGATGRGARLRGRPADPEPGSATAAAAGGTGGPQAAGSEEEVCRPASPSTSDPGGGGSQTQGAGGCGKRRSGAGCADKLNRFEKTAGDQEARGRPREAGATRRRAEQAAAGGGAGVTTSGGPAAGESLPGRGVTSGRRRHRGVSHGSLMATFNEFLSGFCRAYGSLIPLQKCDIRRSLRWPEMDVRERDMLVVSMVTRFRSRAVRTTSPAFQVVYRKHTLTLEDLATLANQNWLNDQVINMYGELIMDSTDNKVHFLNSFFHHQLETKGYEGVRRWTKQVNLFSKRLVLVPVHLEVHWCLVAVDPGQRRVRLYDSSDCASVAAAATVSILKYLTREAKEKSQKCFQTGWMASNTKGIPKQNNENDCGVFVLEYCKRLAFRKPLTFSQKEIPSIRKTIYKELCERKLHV